MNKALRILSASIASIVALSGALHGRAVTTTPLLIGQRHVGLDFSYANSSSSRIGNSDGVVASANLPLTASFDASVAYDYGRISGSAYSSQNHTATVSLLRYNVTEYGKPYFVATLGHGWDRQKVLGIRKSDTGALWGLGAGVEFSIANLLAMDGSVSFLDEFEGDRSAVVRYQLSGQHWITPEVAARGSIGYDQTSKGPDAATFRLGVRMLF
jgi:hypothetical protein